MKKEMICICCPRGCRLTVERADENSEWNVTGNQCPRGVTYAIQEISNPCRTVTAVVRTNSLNVLFLPVRTDRPCPRGEVASLLNALYAMEVKVPVRRGDVILADFNGTGVNVVASETISE